MNELFALLVALVLLVPAPSGARRAEPSGKQACAKQSVNTVAKELVRIEQRLMVAKTYLEALVALKFRHGGDTRITTALQSIIATAPKIVSNATALRDSQ
jgi:hypothetical protein